MLYLSTLLLDEAALLYSRFVADEVAPTLFHVTFEIKLTPHS